MTALIPPAAELTPMSPTVTQTPPTPTVPRPAAGHAPVETVPSASLADVNVLVIGINYAPEVTGIAPYTTAMAEHFARCGANVTVLAGVPHYPSWTVDELYRRRLRTRQQQNGVDVLRLRHHVPRKQSAARRALYEATFLAHALAAPLPRRPDVVLAVVPSLGSGACAAQLARRFRVPLVVHVQDLLGQAATQSGIAGGSRVAGATSALEAWVLRQATVVGVVSESFRPVLHEYGVAAGRVVSLPNWSHVAPASGDTQEVRRDLGWADGLTVALHSGNMGLKQDLGNVLEAARLTTGRRDLLYVLMGDGSQRRELEHQAEGLPNVRFLDPVANEQYVDVLRAADILLLNERASVVDMSLPSKLTSYFRAGRPVVAATAPGGATAQELARVGAAVTVPAGEPRRLADAIVSLADSQPDSRRRARQGGLRLRRAAPRRGSRHDPCAKPPIAIARLGRRPHRRAGTR